MELGLFSVKSSGLDLVCASAGNKLGLASIVGSLPLSGADLVLWRLSLGESGVSLVDIGGRRNDSLINEGRPEFLAHRV